MKLKVLEQLILLALISLVRNRSSCFFSVPVLVAFYSSTFAFSRLEQWSFPKSLDPFHGPRYQRRSASEVGPGCDHQKKGCLRTPHFPVSEAPLPRKGQPLLKCLTAMEHASRSKLKQPRTLEIGLSMRQLPRILWMKFAENLVHRAMITTPSNLRCISVDKKTRVRAAEYARYSFAQTRLGSALQ